MKEPKIPNKTTKIFEKLKHSGMDKPFNFGRDETCILESEEFNGLISGIVGSEKYQDSAIWRESRRNRLKAFLRKNKDRII